MRRARVAQWGVVKLWSNALCHSRLRTAHWAALRQKNKNKKQAVWVHMQRDKYNCSPCHVLPFFLRGEDVHCPCRGHYLMVPSAKPRSWKLSTAIGSFCMHLWQKKRCHVWHLTVTCGSDMNDLSARGTGKLLSFVTTVFSCWILLIASHSESPLLSAFPFIQRGNRGEISAGHWFHLTVFQWH